MSDSKTITSARLRESLAGTRLPTDPTDVVMPPNSETWPQSVRDKLTESLRPAGVLVPIIDSQGAELSVLLTQRSAELRHHAGQVSFPGGGMEPQDTDIGATALREAHEEVGIHRENVSVIGYLQPMPTVTGYAVTPVVGIVDGSTELTIDRIEVEYAFKVPLAFLTDRRNQRIGEREVHGQKLPIVEFHYEGQRIWGATASIIVQLANIVIK